MLAAQNGHYDTVLALLDNRAVIDMKDTVSD